MKIRDLEDDTAYTFHIYALTETGRGPAYYIQESTLPSFGKRADLVVSIVIIQWYSIFYGQRPQNPLRAKQVQPLKLCLMNACLNI